ncbi:hypothetical protein AURDEDRAFT_125298 [Auricularia subglabra TFB-10046 SS5]|nr:hypothetical protein AURDEDRAFT_125298 [Auricularia subglabra TFB-10046 SS5]
MACLRAESITLQTRVTPQTTTRLPNRRGHTIDEETNPKKGVTDVRPLLSGDQVPLRDGSLESGQGSAPGQEESPDQGSEYSNTRSQSEGKDSTQDQSKKSFTDQAPQSVQEPLTPKPTGHVAAGNRAGYTLRDVLQWDKERYESVQAMIDGLAAEHLDPARPFTKQDAGKVDIVCQMACQRDMRLLRYEHLWPIKDFVKLYLQRSMKPRD